MSGDTICAIPTKKPRCYLVYALAPQGVQASDANRIINEMTADLHLPLALWHDHFIGQPGGSIIFYVETQDEQQALFESQYLKSWKVDYRPLVFSFNPAAFDAQTGFTLKNYRATDWQQLRTQARPNYGERNVASEAETAEEA
jgi:hypothetical protein